MKSVQRMVRHEEGRDGVAAALAQVARRADKCVWEIVWSYLRDQVFPVCNLITTASSEEAM